MSYHHALKKRHADYVNRIYSMTKSGWVVTLVCSRCKNNVYT